MALSQRHYEMACMILVGIGTVFNFAGYSTQSFLSETVLHTLSEKHPDRISTYDGYYGVGIHYCAFAITSLFTPALANHISSKFMLGLNALLMCLFFLGFLYVHYLYFYFSQIMLGAAYAIFNNGEGAYISEHSSHKTLQSNSALETAVSHSTSFFAGLNLIFVIYIITLNSPNHQFEFKEDQILMLYMALLGTTLIGFLIFVFLPTKQVNSIAQEHTKASRPLSRQLKSTLSVLKEGIVWKMLPFSLHMGIYVSLYMSVFPTTLHFAKATSDDNYIVAAFAVALGGSECICGIVINRITKRFGRHGLKFNLLIHICALATAIVLLYLTVPNRATFEATDEEVFFTPSRITAFLGGLIFGVVDFTWTTGRLVFCQKVLPKKRMEVFAITRIYQAFAGGAMLFLTPMMTKTTWCIVIAISATIGSVFFLILDSKIQTIAPASDEPADDVDENKTVDSEQS